MSFHSVRALKAQKPFESFSFHACMQQAVTKGGNETMIYNCQMNIKCINHSHSGPMKTFPHEGLSGGEKNSIKFRKDNVLRFFFFSTLHLSLFLEFPRRGVMAFCPFQFLLITATAETKGRKKKKKVPRNTFEMTRSWLFFYASFFALPAQAQHQQKQIERVIFLRDRNHWFEVGRLLSKGLSWMSEGDISIGHCGTRTWGSNIGLSSVIMEMCRMVAYGTRTRRD